MSDRFYIGFPQLEKMLWEFDSGERNPLYVSTMVLTSAGQYNTENSISYVVVSAIQPDACWYWLIRTGETSNFGFTDEVGIERVNHRTKSLKNVIVEYLHSHGATYTIEALISFPKDLRLVEGTFDMLGYSKDTNEFFIKCKGLYPSGCPINGKAWKDGVCADCYNAGETLAEEMEANIDEKSNLRG